MEKKKWLARFQASTRKGRFRQLQLLCYLQFVVILEALLLIVMLLWRK